MTARQNGVGVDVKRTPAAQCRAFLAGCSPAMMNRATVPSQTGKDKFPKSNLLVPHNHWEAYIKCYGYHGRRRCVKNRTARENV